MRHFQAGWATQTSSGAMLLEASFSSSSLLAPIRSPQEARSRTEDPIRGDAVIEASKRELQFPMKCSPLYPGLMSRHTCKLRQRQCVRSHKPENNTLFYRFSSLLPVIKQQSECFLFVAFKKLTLKFVEFSRKFCHYIKRRYKLVERGGREEKTLVR